MRHLGLHAHACLRGYTLSQGNEPLYETRRQGLFHRVYPGSGVARANRSEPHASDVSARASGGLRRDAGRAGFGGGVRRVRLRSDGGEIWPGSRRLLPGELAQTALRRLPRRLRFGEALNRRSEEHTSELQSHSDLVCRLLLEKKKKIEESIDRLIFNVVRTGS